LLNVGGCAAVFSVKDLGEAEASFDALPSQARGRFVRALTDDSLERKPDDVKLLTKLFARLAAESVVSREAFTEGLQPVAIQLSDLAIDYPTGKCRFFFLVAV
jgi:hypothetical protein